MLAIAVHYLTGRVYAASLQDRSVVEWPPHPARLFSALVAALYNSDLEKEKGRQVLQWLEQQPPPLLSYPPHTARSSSYCVFVPVNDAKEDRLLENREKQPRFFPSATIGGDSTVYYIWPDACPNAEQQTLLDQIAAHVGYLGNSMSLVSVYLTSSPPEPVLVPDRTGPIVLRVVYPGRLKELENLYKAGLRPSSGKQQRYKPAKDDEAVKRHTSSLFGEMYPLKINYKYLPVEASLTLTAAFRKAIIANVPEPVPPEIHGHINKPHCAFIPLAYVGSRYADGRIMGVAILLPEQMDEKAREAAFKACQAIKKIRLSKQICLELSRVDFTAGKVVNTLTPERWTRPSARWASVTPVIFDRFPKRHKGTAEEIIASSCEQIGLPRPVDVKISGFSFLEGVPPARSFRVKRSSDEPEHYISHVEVIFNEPVKGPVILGAGRYFGMGLCAPVS